MRILICLLILLSSASVSANDVNVSGYYRKNGTYVQPHVRSAPDSSKANNYGSSSGSTYQAPQARDRDSDGTPNYLDNDDNNDGIHDDN